MATSSGSPDIRNALSSWLSAYRTGDLVAFLLIVQLISNAKLLAIAFGNSSLLVACGGLALLFYGRATHDNCSATLGWTGRCQMVKASLIGFLLAGLVTASSLTLGHSLRVTEPVYNQILAVTLGPIVEESLLRGMAVPLLAKAAGPRWAVFLTGVFFAALHWPASHLKLASIVVTGVAYGQIKIQSGSTALSALTHAIYNLTILMFSVAVS